MGIKIDDDTLKSIYAAADYYGAEAQARQCMEECAELIVALNKYLRATVGGQNVQKPAYELWCDVVEELADVFIMVHEMSRLMLCECEVADMVKVKAARTVERMRKEKDNE